MNLFTSPYITYSGKPVQQLWFNNKLVWSAGFFWTGLGADDNWSTGSNWNGSQSPAVSSSLTFGGTTRLSAVNDIAVDAAFGGITFNSSAGTFQLYGNRIIFGAEGITTNSTSPQFINNDIKLSSGNNIINTTTGSITFNGKLSGVGSIVKTGSGIVHLSAAKSIFTGSVTISAGTLRLNNSIDSATPISTIYNLTGSGAVLELQTVGSERLSLKNKTINFSSAGNQTVSISGNNLLNALTIVTNGGPKNFITSPIFLPSYFNGQYQPITYNVADGTEDVDLEVNAYLYLHSILKTGAGKMSVTYPSAYGGIGIGASNITISSGIFDVGSTCNFGTWTGTMTNNAVFLYSSNSSSDISSRAISGTGNIIKDGTSILTLSSNNLSYGGSTSILNGSLVTSKDSATATFSNTTLTVNFSTPPNISDVFKFFPGSTVQTYASVSLIGAPGRTASYNSTNSTLTIIS